MWIVTGFPLTAWWEEWSLGLRFQWPFAFFLRLSCTYLSASSGGGLVTNSCLTLATLWPIACQAPLSMGFSKQEYCGVDCHFLLQGIFLTQELNPGLLHCRQILY